MIVIISKTKFMMLVCSNSLCRVYINRTRNRRTGTSTFPPAMIGDCPSNLESTMKGA
jgi:hypothetical protein